MPRVPGTDRSHCFADNAVGTGARLENGSLVRSKIGRLAVRWSRPMQGTSKTVTISNEADGWYVCCSCAAVAVERLPLTGKETGIEVGVQVVLLTADGQLVENPRPSRTAEQHLNKAQQRVWRRTKGSRRRRTAVQQCAKRHQHVRRPRATFPPKTALALVREYDVLYVQALQPSNLSRRPAPKQDESGH